VSSFLAFRVARFSRLALLVVVAGCSRGPGALRPPRIDAIAAASEVMKSLDRDGDGKLSRAEWSGSPEIAAIAASYDKNSDGFLESAELVGGFEAWQKTGVGARSVPFRVTLNGSPLAGATVRLVPAEFLGKAVKPASAQTGQTGGGQLAMAAEDRPKNAPNMPLVQPGIYRVEITHPSAKIPAKYNTETSLGIEITSLNPGPDGAIWSLTNK
jgi:hypothetical protein